MRTHYWLIIVLVVGAGGIALGYVISPGGGARPEVGVRNDEPRPVISETEAEERGDDSRAAEDSSPVRERSEGKAQRSPVVPTTPESAVSDEELVAVLNKIAPTHEVSGDGVLRGTVHDTSGEPIAGVAVTAVFRPDAGWGRTFRVYDVMGRGLWEGIREDVQELVEIRRTMYGGDRTVKTDGDGVFEIRGLADERYHCLLHHDDYEFRGAGSQFHFRPGDEPKYIGERVYPVRVALEQSGDVAPRPGRLRLSRLETGSQVPVSTRSEATEWDLRLPPGAYAADVEYHNPRGSTESTLFVVEADEDSQQVIIPYNAEWTLKVVVETGALTSNYGLDVYCVPDNSDRDPIDVLSRSESPLKKVSSVVADRAHFGLPSPGRYVLGVRKDNRFLAWKRIEWTGDGTTEHIKVKTPQAVECIVCEIDAARGGWLRSPNFRIEQGESSFSPISWGTSDGDYLLQIPDDPSYDLHAPALLTVSDVVFGTQTLKLRHSGPQTARIRVAETGYLVLEWNARSLGNYRARVNLFDSRGERSYEKSFRPTSSVSNSKVVRHVAPGQYRMVVYVGSRATWPIYSAEIEISVGFNRHSVEVPELTTVTVEIEKEDVGSVNLVAELQGEEVEESLHIRRGQPTTVTSLPPGFYTLRYRVHRDREEHEISFTLPGTERVVIR